ncbi:MAG: hypothetical protein E7047_00615 [Lentisphaerae bacterium]|nr:hypothetical protein [Lentisphaerota bacterium]
MNRNIFCITLLTVSVLCPAISWGSGSVGSRIDAQTTTTTTTTTTVVSQTQTVVKKEKEWRPFKVCVLDFTSIDILGQKRFLDVRNQPIVIPAQSTLTPDDNAAMCAVMQGWVRMIDAEDNSRTNEANRTVQMDDNDFERAKALELYKKIVAGPSRPMVIGANYLSAYLGQYNDVFSCMDQSLILSAMYKLQDSKDFPKDYMINLARETGATHLIYGTVSDIRSGEKSFKGYGIETKTLVYELDVVVKMVDLVAQGTVYSNVYTGVYQIKLPAVGGETLSNDVFQLLMKSALQQAADDLYSVCKPGRKNKVTVTPLPENKK